MEEFLLTPFLNVCECVRSFKYYHLLHLMLLFLQLLCHDLGLKVESRENGVVRESTHPKFLFLRSTSSSGTCSTTGPTTHGSSAGSAKLTAFSRSATQWSLPERGAGWRQIEVKKWTTRRWVELCDTTTVVQVEKATWPWSRRRGSCTDLANWPFVGDPVKCRWKIVRSMNCANKVFVYGRKSKKQHLVQMTIWHNINISTNNF